MEFEDSIGAPLEQSDTGPNEQPTKSKARARLLHGLQRIASSPSLAQLSRKRAHSNPYPGKSSLSCVSLASPSPAVSTQSSSNASSSQSTAASQSTAQTSAPATPGIDGDNLPVRVVSRAGTSTPISALPLEIRPSSKGALTQYATTSASPALTEISESYFSIPIAKPKTARVRRPKLDFWGEMPHEISISILSYLKPKELVRSSRVSKGFHKLCFDGQLWTCFDASEFYKDIPAESLAKIIVAAGPFVKDLNLRGCVQVEHFKRAEVVVKACKNLMNATLEGCRNFQRSTLHNLLKSNEKLTNLNLTGLTAVTNGTCRIIAQSCPQLEMFNVSWCTHMDARGIKAIILGCSLLKDLRAGEIRGFNDLELAQDIFETNRLERLVLSGCADITDQALKVMIIGREPEIDILTNLPVVPPRRLRHLDLSRCTRLTAVGVKSLAHQVPFLEGLQLSGCTGLTDAALEELLSTTPHLTHLDLEELSQLTNNLLSEHLAKAPCASSLKHLSISYCEHLGDAGMIPVVKACTSLQSIDMDNTRIGDLVLAEAASMVRSRSPRTSSFHSRPLIGLRMVIFDCQNVTWTGIREVLSRNSEVRKPISMHISADASNGSVKASRKDLTYPTEIIGLKCYYGWQMTVDEHTKRVLKGDLPAAGRLERKWVEYMMANEEAGVAGAGARRRRRRAREAQLLHADEEEGGMGNGGGGIGRRRRARSSGCAVM